MGGQSAYRLVSLGTVAADKNEGSKFITVHLREALPFYEGDITDDHVTIERSGTDAHGENYTAYIQRGIVVKAEWKGEKNRLSAPNVRKGMEVEVFELGNTGRYYWDYTGRDSHLMRGETVTYGYSASGAENTKDEPATAQNTYTMTFDGKNGHLTLKTTQANGEQAAYTLQMNGRQGHFTIQDGEGNLFQLNSVEGSQTLKNKQGSYIQMKGDTITFGAAKEIHKGLVTFEEDVTFIKKASGPEAKFTTVITDNLQAKNNPI